MNSVKPDKPVNTNVSAADMPLRTWEFVAMMAGLISLNALAIDTMLPALGQIADDYNLANPNDRQLVLYAFLIGFGAPQLIFGPVSDRFGRKGLLLACIGVYSLIGFASMAVPSFAALLALRFFQGIAASGVRVIAVSVVRDVVKGRVMARIMSLVMTVFMIVPILAPALGQIIMNALSWQWTFGILGVVGLIMLVWAGLRLPETLPPQRRQTLSFISFFTSYIKVLSVRQTLGYMAASGVVFGALFGFIGASEQIFSDVFDQGERFAFLFALIASALAVANLLNAKLVERFGMRRISHSVLILFIALNLMNIIALKAGGESLPVFMLFFSLTFGCFGMMGANFSSLAMELQGENAGAASAAYGFATTTIAGGFGWLVSSRFDGTVYPILYGFLGLGLLSLLIVLMTEGGRLFEPGEGKS